MTRFHYVILMNLLRMPFMVPLMRYLSGHPEKYTEEQRYSLAQRLIHIVEHTGWIKTKVIGLDNLPDSGGYIMCPNHQGKYDALGIMTKHPEPCSFVIDDARSHGLLVREFTDLVDGKRLPKKDPRETISLFDEITEDLSNGRKFILFPEGGYTDDKHNVLGRFHAGSFKLAKRSGVPIVPVALIDTYKVFNGRCRDNYGRVKPVVEYLEPISYEEYKDLRTAQIAELVRDRISTAIREWECAAS